MIAAFNSNSIVCLVAPVMIEYVAEARQGRSKRTAIAGQHNNQQSKQTARAGQNDIRMECCWNVLA